MQIPVKIQFVSNEAKELYNGELKYETEGSSGFDLRACSYSQWYEPAIQHVNVEVEKLSQGQFVFEITNKFEYMKVYDDKIIINLVSKYKTNLGDDDWSNGTFIQGSVAVNTEADVNKIIDTFLHERKITLYEVGKNDNISKELSTVSFPSEKYFGGEVYGGNIGFGRIKINPNHDQYVYFLDITRPKKSITLAPNGRILVKTGIKVNLQSNNYEIQVRTRSGLASKNGIIVLNSPGTVDSDYQKEICVILHNTSNTAFEIEKGMRIAQAVICPVIKANFEYVESIEDGSRGGFGSTGIK